MAAEHAAAITEERKQLLTELDQDRLKLMRLRAALNQRKETLRLSVAQFQVRKLNGPSSVAASIDKTMTRWASVHQKLAHSRRVLVAELVTLFDLRHAPERRQRPAPLPASYDPLDQSTLSTNSTLTNNTATTAATAKDGTKKTTKLRVRDYLEDDSWKEYLIVGRPLPTGYFENYDTDEINTTIENVIHMMTLVACYLGIKLPFDTFTRSSKYYIQAAFTAGSKRAPLFLSESNISSFAAGLGHLNYNIAYLCYCQGVHITLANATNTLENLLACCVAPNLGRYTNYAAIMTKKPEDPSDMNMDDVEDSTVSHASDDGDFETIDPYHRTRAHTSFREPYERNEHLLWAPGHEPFDLNVHDLISVIRRRREEESPVWGGLHLQDAVAGNLDPLEDDYFMHEDQEEEDGMYSTPDTRVRGIGSGPGSSSTHHGDSTSTSLSLQGRRPAHPRDRHPYQQQQQHSQQQSSNGGLGSNTQQNESHGQPENWTFLDVDIFRAPSSMNRVSGMSNGSSLLSGIGWADISKLKQLGSAVGGAAVGLVRTGAANVSNTGRAAFSSSTGSISLSKKAGDSVGGGGGESGSTSRRGSEIPLPAGASRLRNAFPTISSSAPP
ncbi:hypothetical protein BGZ94_000652 [Podila epigama]|nr:hypothetical protein BGZ94_000652 [Podila epigama]